MKINFLAWCLVYSYKQGPLPVIYGLQSAYTQVMEAGRAAEARNQGVGGREVLSAGPCIALLSYQVA